MKSFDDYEKVMNRNYGSNVYHSNMFDHSFYYTDGIEDFANTMEAYWFIDMVESHCASIREFNAENDMDSETMFITLSVNDNEADFKVTCYLYEEPEDEDEDMEEVETEIVHQHIPFTDLPNGEYKFFLGKQGFDELVLFLTSEY